MLLPDAAYLFAICCAQDVESWWNLITCGQEEVTTALQEV